MNDIQREEQVGTLRHRAAVWIESPRVTNFVVALIILNAITLGLETSTTAMAHFGGVLLAFDRLILGVFVVEITIKLFAFRWWFFRKAWNVFDFLIVAIALVPTSGPLAIMRVLRILRVLRLVSMVPRLRFVVEALLRAIPGIASIGILMLVLFYVFAVMATGLFGNTHPQFFGNIGRSMYTLFQIMTLESWSMGIVRPIMETQSYYAWVFFIPFILIATFTILNLFIAIIVDTMQTMHEATYKQEEKLITEAVHQEGSHIERELQAVREELQTIKTLLTSTRNT